MASGEKRLGSVRTKPVLQRIEQMHPYILFCYLTIASSFLFNVFLIISFLQKSALQFGPVGPQHFPKSFHLSTLLLVGTITLAGGILSAYGSDEVRDLRKKLSYMVISGLIFIILQALSWIELLGTNGSLPVALYNDYLYLFSGIFSLHIVAATVFIGFQFYRIASVEGDPVKSLILLTNPYEKVKLEVFVAFWRYTAAAWLTVYLFYLFVY
jgi:cytochrome c oxidase subunit 3